MVKGLHQLSEIKVCRCNSMEKVVFGDGDASADNEVEFFSLHSLTLQQLQSLDSFFSYELTSPEPMHQRSTETHIPFFKAQVAFPNLETLKLSSLNLNNIWEDNQHCFSKMTNLIVESCGGLKYLFSCNMVRSFSNLIKLEISNCRMMEEIITTEERNSNIVASEEVRFSKLDTIILKDMENLKTIWHDQFDTLKTLQVKNCQQLVVVFPSSMQKTYNNLEILIVADCPLMEEIFELTSNEKCATEDTTHLKKIILRSLPTLKHTWSRDPEGIVRFPNLEYVLLEICTNLQYLFPFSVATSCSSNLQRLQIIRCGNMKEIIAQKEGCLSTTAIFKFNQLNTLLFWDLCELKGFYASSHTLECPSLRRIEVAGCTKLNLFRTESTSSQKLLPDGKIEVPEQQSPFIVEQMIPNLEELRIDRKEGTTILQAQAQRSVPLFTKLSFLAPCNYENEDSAFPDWFLENVNTLECLVVGRSSAKKIFLDERRANEKNCVRLKKLTLGHLPKLLHICEEAFQIDPVLEVLEYLWVFECPSLLNLVPSSVTFSHLVFLGVQNCNGMVNLISSSTARSLAKLSEMTVNGCNSLEEIIMVEDEDETLHDITLLNLRILVLKRLPRLNSFCSSKCFLRFPLLKEVVVRQCPRMKNFSEGDISTPKLRKVRTGENKIEGHWKRDLNSTIKNMFEDQLAFPNREALMLSSLNLNNNWEDNQRCFHNLTSLIVESCGQLKYLFSFNMVRNFPNLMKLEISDCCMMEEIIATKEGNNYIAASKEVRFSKLDTIVLKDMENLKTIWHNQFDTLKTLRVENCQQLVVVFRSSMLKTYNNLETLIVADCPLVEEIFELTSNEKCATEDTTHLKRITLRSLPTLKHTWSRDPEGILRFPNLEDVFLERCANLQYLFPFSVATSCSSNLQRLQIKWCGNMKQIIAQKEGCLSTAAVLKFNQLNTLFFWDLYELRGFYACTHTLECPSLRAIDVRGCAQLNLFRTVSTSSHRLLDVSVHQSPFIVEQVIPSLEMLVINQKEGTIIWQALAQMSVPVFTRLSSLGLCNYENEDSAFPDLFLQNANTLERLAVERSSFKKIFLDERRANEKNCMQLKKLILNQLPKLLYICEEAFQIDPVLEFLEYLWVSECPSLLNLVPSSVTFGHLVYLVVQNCNGMVNLISSSTARSLAKLTEMTVNGCNSLEEIIMVEDEDETIHDITFLNLKILMLERLPRLNRFCSSKCFLRFPLLKEVVVRQCPRMKNFSEGDISTPKLRKVRTGENKKEGHWKRDLNSTIKNMFEDQLAFPNPKALMLSSLDLNNIWEDNQRCFHNLTSLIVESCGQLKYLFSFNMVRNFPNLMKLEISDCCMMEEIIGTKEGNNYIAASEEVRFSKMDTIILKDMENLKTIWHDQFDTLKMLQVENCRQLMVVFPSSIQKTYNNLETLIVADCPLVEEIFELTSNEKCVIEDTTHLRRITLRSLPELKHTWSRDPEGILHFPNLEDVCLESCTNLQYLFPFSVATSCSSNLQTLDIRDCGNMKEIIAQKEGTLSTSAIFNFNQLNALLFWFLYELKGFYASSHTLECPSLKRIDVAGCTKLNLFRTEATSSQKLLPDGQIDVPEQQSPFIVEQVIPNLEELRMNQKEGTIILQAQAQMSAPLFPKLSFLGLCDYENEDSAFPDWFLQNVNTLEVLVISNSSFKKIFLDERRADEKNCMQLKKLILNQLPKLLHICEEAFQIDPILEFLEYLWVGECPSLLSLVPSSVTFGHLVYLEVQHCNGMVNLISSSTARSLAKLTEMTVHGCDSLEEIIMVEDEDETIHDITFLNLKILMLERLPRLNRFCSSKCFLRFPLLKEAVVRQCPRMKNFSEGDISTPKLRKVRTGENKKEGHWKGDLNSTIKNMFEDQGELKEPLADVDDSYDGATNSPGSKGYTLNEVEENGKDAKGEPAAESEADFTVEKKVF